MKTIKNLLAIGVLAALAGCSATTTSHATKKGDFYTQDKSKSLAWNIAAFGGYPSVFTDHPYTKAIGDGATIAANAIVLKDGSPTLGVADAIGLSIGINILTSAADNYPLDAAEILFIPLLNGEQFDSPSVIDRLVQERLQFRQPYQNESQSSGIVKFLSSAKMSETKCLPYSPSLLSKANWTYKCSNPVDDRYTLLVQAVRPANGTEFPGLVNLANGRYAAVIMRADRGSAFETKSKENVFYMLGLGKTYATGNNTIIPFLSPRPDGKRLIVKDGKAQYL